LPTTRHRYNFEVWALAQSHGDGHRSLVTSKRVLSEYTEDLISTKFTQSAIPYVQISSASRVQTTAFRIFFQLFKAF